MNLCESSLSHAAPGTSDTEDMMTPTTQRKLSIAPPERLFRADVAVSIINKKQPKTSSPTRRRLGYKHLSTVSLLNCFFLSRAETNTPGRSEERRVGKECRSRW